MLVRPAGTVLAVFQLYFQCGQCITYFIASGIVLFLPAFFTDVDNQLHQTIGNAIVDVMAPADDALLANEGLTKGGMMLIDEERAEQLYARKPNPA